MNAQTRAVAAVLFETDGTIPRDRIAAALDFLESKADLPTATTARTFPPIMSPKEVARATNLSTRSLRTYAQRGEIRRAYFSQGKRKCAGYDGESVRAFIERATKVDAARPPHETEVEVIEN